MGEALLLSSRQAPPRCVGQSSQSDQLEERVGIFGVLVVAGEELQHPASADRGVDTAMLEHHPDTRHEQSVLRDRVAPEHPHNSCRGTPVALERLDGRGLSRSVRAQKRQHLAVLGREREAVHRHERSVAHDESTAVDRMHGHSRRGYLWVLPLSAT
ncbi:MAG: hypothetical protein ABSB99_08250 [Acidimicrobiales bacterium]|jgi:hypothetical protein